MKKQIKRILAGVLAVATLFLATPISNISTSPLALKSNFTVSAETYGDLTYEIINDEISITGCSQSATEVVIPSEIDGIPVTSIGDWAFSGCSNLTTINIPNSVTNIGEHAFSGSSLTSITIPDSVTSIGEYAFSGSSLTSITIPDSITSIDVRAFSGCTSLTSIIIPDSVTSISDYAFSWCESLTSITIPNSVTSIGEGAFYSCLSLTSITIPNSITSIENEAFSRCSSLTSITIPNSVTSIGEGAFYSCLSLTSITIPNSITSIENEAFSDCSKLTSIYVDEDNQYYSDIDGILFNKDKTSLIQYSIGKSSTEYEIPNSVIIIDASAFIGCSSLESITIPDSVTYIGGYAFSGCSSLESITISDSVTYIGWSAFSGCSKLTSISVDEKNQDYCDIDGVLFNKDKTTINTYPIGKTSTEYVIPNSVISIGDTAFSGCSRLTTIEVPDSVTSIGYGAFYYCSSLTTITIPDSVTSIEHWTFYSCLSLTSITIPDSVTYIGDYAFHHDYHDYQKTIYGYTGSYAEAYASEQGITFIPLDVEFETGDLTGDSVSDSSDITFLKQAIYGRQTLSPNQVKAADINADGKLDVFDLALLKRNILN